MHMNVSSVNNLTNDENYIKWDSKFETGIVYIDNEHKYLVKLCSDTYRELLSNRNSSSWHDTVRGTIKECANYVQVHFNDEERLLRAINYADFETHKKRHNEFIKKVVEVSQSFETMEILDALKFVKFLYDWILTHIAHEDKMYISDALKHCDANGNVLISF